MSMTTNSISTVTVRTAAPVRVRATRPPSRDATLLRECAEFQEIDALLRRWEAVRVEGDAVNDDTLAAVVDEWWKSVHSITDIPAVTIAGRLAKLDAALIAARDHLGGESSPRGALALSALSAMAPDTAATSYSAAPSPDMDLLNACGAILVTKRLQETAIDAVNAIRGAIGVTTRVVRRCPESVNIRETI